VNFSEESEKKRIRQHKTALEKDIYNNNHDGSTCLAACKEPLWFFLACGSELTSKGENNGCRRHEPA
jgi:hypothetical protein